MRFIPKEDWQDDFQPNGFADNGCVVDEQRFRDRKLNSSLNSLKLKTNFNTVSRSAATTTSSYLERFNTARNAQQGDFSFSTQSTMAIREWSTR